jgi:hypothetical protein
MRFTPSREEGGNTMKSNAQRDESALWEDGPLFPAEESAAMLRRLAAERLAAHRSRRAAQMGDVAAPRPLMAEAVQVDSAAARVREAVAARYRASLSYEEFLEAGSREQEVGSREQEVGSRTEGAVQAEFAPLEIAEAVAAPAIFVEPVVEAKAVAVSAEAGAWEPVVVSLPELPREAAVPVAASSAPVQASLQEAAALDEEIAFRMAPEFDEHLLEPLALQANIIEFPRQLVAAKKARPRLAEAPLLALQDEASAEPAAEEQQLRIFEVMAEVAAELPVAFAATVAEPPSWQSEPVVPARTVLPEVAVDPEREAEVRRLVELDELAEEQPELARDMLLRESAPLVEAALPNLYMPVFTASMDLRLMAAMVDACCVGLAYVVFAGVGAMAAGGALRTVAPWKLESVAALALVGLFVAYQWLFLTLGEATPGMLYAKVSLCTFADGTPTRKMRQKRVWKLLLAMMPMGLGVLWMLVDTDHLGWHDKWSRMYPRAY